MGKFLTQTALMTLAIVGLINAQGGYFGEGEEGRYSSGVIGSTSSYSTPGVSNFNSGYTQQHQGQRSYQSNAHAAPKVFRHVWVHQAPSDPDDGAARVIRVPGKKDKHVNIIFVKAPSSGGEQGTELILPPADEHKNIVYVLVKREDLAANLKVTRPSVSGKKNSKPEVYFIRYKDAGQGQVGGNKNGGVEVGSSNLAAFQQQGQRGTDAGSFGGSSAYGLSL